MRWGVFGGVAAVAAVVLVVCYILFFGKWSAEKVYSHYKNSVVFIYKVVNYDVKLSGVDLQQAMYNEGLKGRYPNSGSFAGSGSGLLYREMEKC